MVYEAIKIVKGFEAEKAIERILRRPEVAVIHSRNLMPGCYMFAILRSAS